MGYNRASDIWSRAFDSTNNLLRTNNVISGSFSVGQYLSTATTYTSNASVPLQTDASGNLKTTLGTKIAGEDITNDVMKTEQRYSYTSFVSAGTVAIKQSAGFLHLINIGMPSCPTITILDSLIPSGPKIIQLAAGYPMGTYLFNNSFATGLSLDTSSGGVNPYIKVSWR